MTKRPSVMSLDDLMRPEPAAVEAPAAQPAPEPEAPVSSGRKATPDGFRTSLYFHRSVHDALRQLAFDERATVSDLINEGLDMVLRARGYPSAAELKAKGLPKRNRARAQ